MNWQSWDWKWIIGSVIIPIGTFVIGLFVGRGVEKRHAKAKVSGSGNMVFQNSKVEGDVKNERAAGKEG